MAQAARDVFSNLPPIPKDVVLAQGTYDEEAVDKWLATKHGIQFDDEGPSNAFNGTDERPLGPTGNAGGAYVEEVDDSTPWDEVMEDDKR